MASCEDCMTLEDLRHFDARDLYIAALGFVHVIEGKSVKSMEMIEPMPKSRLDRMLIGKYGWSVLEYKKLPPEYTKEEAKKMMSDMCAEYGEVSLKSPPKKSRSERMEIVDALIPKLMEKSYVHSVYLTGSMGRKSDPLDKSDSDIDLLVVLNSCPGVDGHMEMDELAEGNGDYVDYYFLTNSDFLQVADSDYSLMKSRVLLAEK